MCMFCKSLFVLLFFFFWPLYCLFCWPLCCLSFFDLRILITTLVSSNSSYFMLCELILRKLHLNKIYSNRLSLFINRTKYKVMLCSRVFNPSFNNTPFITLSSILLMEETIVPLPDRALHRQILSYTIDLKATSISIYSFVNFVGLFLS